MIITKWNYNSNIYYFRYGYIFTSECMPLIYDWQSEMQAVYKWQPGWRFAVCVEATHRDKLVVCVSNENGQWIYHELAMSMRRHTHQFNGNTENCSANWKSQIRTSETHFSIDYFLAHCPTSVWMILTYKHGCGCSCWPDMRIPQWENVRQYCMFAGSKTHAHALPEQNIDVKMLIGVGCNIGDATSTLCAVCQSGSPKAVAQSKILDQKFLKSLR